MKTRVLCCSGSLEGGGSERQLWQLATKLNPAKFSAAIYLLYRKGKYLDFLPEDFPVYDYWSEHSFGPTLPGAISRSQARHLAKAITRCDADVVYDRTFHMTLVTAAACKRAKCRRVSVIVSPPSKDFGGSHEKFKFLKKRILKLAYSDPNSRTLAVSSGVANDAATYFGIRSGRIEVVPSPVDVAAIREAAGIRQDASNKRSICVVGRMTPEKGQRRAIVAFQRFLQDSQSLPNGQTFELNLIGDGPDRKKLEELTADLGIAKNVCFHGFLENPYPMIQDAALLLLPSDYEGLPNVVLEAMVLRTPVLATDCSSSLNELLNANTSDLTGRDLRGTVVALDSEEQTIASLANAMLSRFTQQEEWGSRAARAQKYVTENHSLPAWLQRMDGILSK